MPSRTQLAIVCPDHLREALRAEAARRRVTLGSLVVAWLEAGLEGKLDESGKDLEPSKTQLEQRLERLEKTVEELKSQLAIRTKPRTVKPKREEPRTNSEELPPPVLIAPGSAISTGQLAELLGVRRNAINMAVSRANGSNGFVYRGWQIIGRAKPANGGPEQWQWQQAENS